MLKREKVFIKSLDREVELVELPYRAQMAVMEAYSDGNAADVPLIMVKHGIAEFAEMSIEEMGDRDWETPSLV